MGVFQTVGVARRSGRHVVVPWPRWTLLAGDPGPFGRVLAVGSSPAAIDRAGLWRAFGIRIGGAGRRPTWSPSCPRAWPSWPAARHSCATNYDDRKAPGSSARVSIGLHRRWNRHFPRVNSVHSGVHPPSQSPRRPCARPQAPWPDLEQDGGTRVATAEYPPRSAASPARPGKCARAFRATSAGAYRSFRQGADRKLINEPHQ